ncbi:hypothetical protein [Microbacterium aureliae]
MREHIETLIQAWSEHREDRGHRVRRPRRGEPRVARSTFVPVLRGMRVAH